MNGAILNPQSVSGKSGAYESLMTHAMAHYQANEYAQARVACEELLQLDPLNYDVLQLAGVIATEEHRLPEAADFLKRALAQAPNPKCAAASWYALGKALRAAGDLRQAEEALRRAVYTDPRVCEYLVELADIYAEGWKLDLAIKTLKTAINRFFDNALPCAALGNLLNRVGKQADALLAFKLAAERKPDYADAHLAQGSTLMMLGRFKEAEAPMREALRLNPMLKALYQLAQIRKFAVNDEDLAAIKLRLDPQVNAGKEARVDALFALSKIYDQQGDYAAAFQHLEQATQLHRSSNEFSSIQYEVMTDSIIEFFTPDFLTRHSGKSRSELAPIFIVGMFRSGTTLTEQILASHSQVQAGGELLCMVQIAKQLSATWQSRGHSAPGDDLEIANDLTRCATRYQEMTAFLSANNKRITDKLPLNFFNIGLIHLLFQNANIIYCRRNPVATCFSCYQNNILMPADGSFTHDLTDLGRFYRLHERVMQHWQAVLPERILQVDYEKMVEDPETETRRLLDFCGLPFEPQCLNFHATKRPVATASVLQVRRPIYKGSVDHWKNYAEFLAPLFQALQVPAPEQTTALKTN